MKRRWFLAGLALPLVSAGCRGIGQSGSSPDSADVDSKGLSRITRNNKTLVMATSANYPPYQQITEVSDEGAELISSDGSEVAGNVVGFDIDLAQLIARRLDRQLTIVDLEFGAIIPAVTNDEVDMAMAALAPNRNRKQKVDFSNIYYRSRHALISLDGYLRSRDLTYQTIGVRANSVQARYADNLLNEISGLDIVPYETLREVFEALDIGAVEGAIVEANVASSYLRRYPEFAGKIMPTEKATGSAIALPKNSPLRRSINAAIIDIKASGEMEQLIEKWFS